MRRSRSSCRPRMRLRSSSSSAARKRRACASSRAVRTADAPPSASQVRSTRCARGSRSRSLPRRRATAASRAAAVRRRRATVRECRRASADRIVASPAASLTTVRSASASPTNGARNTASHATRSSGDSSARDQRFEVAHHRDVGQRFELHADERHCARRRGFANGAQMRTRARQHRDAIRRAALRFSSAIRSAARSASAAGPQSAVDAIDARLAARDWRARRRWPGAARRSCARRRRPGTRARTRRCTSAPAPAPSGNCAAVPASSAASPSSPAARTVEKRPTSALRNP